MPSLHQVLAVEKDIKGKAHRVLTDAHHAVDRAPLLSGIARTYQPREDDGDMLPPESTRVQLRVPDVLAQVSATLANLFDLVAVKDWTNTIAKADVLVGNQVLIENAPVSYLLFLETQLVNVHTFVTKLPTLDPAEQWTYSDDQDCYATAPVQTTRTRKVPRNHVLAEATDHHPAQVTVYNEDVIAGYWTTVKFSGALTARRRAELIARVERLQKAVKQAREHANATPVMQVAPGEAVLAYLFG